MGSYRASCSVYSSLSDLILCALCMAVNCLEVIKCKVFKPRLDAIQHSVVILKQLIFVVGVEPTSLKVT